MSHIYRANDYTLKSGNATWFICSSLVNATLNEVIQLIKILCIDTAYNIANTIRFDM